MILAVLFLIFFVFVIRMVVSVLLKKNLDGLNRSLCPIVCFYVSRKLKLGDLKAGKMNSE